MAHPEQRKFIGALVEPLSAYFNNTRVLEVGSLDINGSVRDFFHGCDYVGLDVAPGKGVDVVCEGQDYDAPSGSFSTVISCEAMEHNPHWAETFKNMVRLCRPAGAVIMSCATYGRREHGTTRSEPGSSPLTLGWDYYRNLGWRDFAGVVDLTEEFAAYCFWTNWHTYDLYFLGIRSPGGPERFMEAVQNVDDYIAAVNARKACRYRRIVGPMGDGWFRMMRGICETFGFGVGNPLYDLHQ